MPTQVETIIAGWSRADEAAQVVGAIANHARHAVRRLDVADADVTTRRGGGGPAPPSVRWNALLDELQDALGRAAEAGDERVREAESDWAMRAASAFLTAEALAVVHSEPPDEPDRPDGPDLDDLVDPAMVVARRLRDFADDVPARPGEPAFEIHEPATPGPGASAAQRLRWLPLLGGLLFLLVSVGVLLPLEAYTAAYVVSVLLAPLVYLLGLYLIGRAESVRPPLWLLERPARLDEIARCGRVLDRGARYLRLYQAHTRELGGLLEGWRRQCEEAGPGLAPTGLDLARVQGSLQHGGAVASTAARALGRAAHDLEEITAEPSPGRVPRPDRAAVEDLVERLRAATRRTAELALDLPLRAERTGPTPPGVDVAALAEHLRRLEKTVTFSAGRAQQALRRATTAAARL